jgi:hypothetical protein
MSASGYVSMNERGAALERILQSKTFAACDTMRHVLKFIVEKSLADRADEIKEYTIATEVLGRPSEFDPKQDNIVRVQVHRLRKKLDEYYNAEGAEDPIRIFIPRGHYYPDFIAAPLVEPPVVDPAPLPAPAAIKKTINWQRLSVGLLVVNLGLSVYLFWNSRTSAKPARTATPLTASLAPLWNPFAHSNQPPLIIYSNGLFLMSEQGDLYRYYTDTSHSLAMGAQVPSLAGLERRGAVPAGVGPLYYFDSYTGVGEVVAAGKVSQLLTRAGQEFSIKRSRVASYDDIRNRNVIFLGASLEDSILGKLPVESELVFEEPMGKEFVGRLLIRDRHPVGGQPATYKFERDPRTKALQSEYALISLLPGVTPGHSILILAGLSTLGTQAAAEFATSEANMLSLGKNGAALSSSSYFQALLEVQIRDGIAVKTSCLLTRELRMKSSAQER